MLMAAHRWLQHRRDDGLLPSPWGMARSLQDHMGASIPLPLQGLDHPTSQKQVYKIQRSLSTGFTTELTNNQRHSQVRGTAPDSSPKADVGMSVLRQSTQSCSLQPATVPFDAMRTNNDTPLFQGIPRRHAQVPVKHKTGVNQGTHRNTPKQDTRKMPHAEYGKHTPLLV
jgi:hypothetical protein